MIKSELDYIFLSENTLMYDTKKLDIKTIKVNVYGEHNHHIIESVDKE